MLNTLEDWFGESFAIGGSDAFLSVAIGPRQRSIHVDSSRDAKTTLVALPDARYLQPGHVLHVVNKSSATGIYLYSKTSAGGISTIYTSSQTGVGLFKLVLDSVVTFYLLDNSTAEGVWFLRMGEDGVTAANDFGMDSRSGTLPSDFDLAEHPTYDPDCSVVYGLTPCDSDAPTIFTRSDLSASINRCVEISSTCYSVDVYRGYLGDKTITAPSVDGTFDSCDECETTYSITPCDGGDTFYTDEDSTPGIGALVGRVVTIGGGTFDPGTGDETYTPVEGWCYTVERSAGTVNSAFTGLVEQEGCDRAPCQSVANVPCGEYCCLEVLDTDVGSRGNWCEASEITGLCDACCLGVCGWLGGLFAASSCGQTYVLTISGENNSGCDPEPAPCTVYTITRVT